MFILTEQCTVGRLNHFDDKQNWKFAGHCRRLTKDVNPEPIKRKYKNEWIGWVFTIRGLVFAVILLTGALIATHRAEDMRNHAEIQKRLDAIRANRQPLTVQDLAKLYPDPPPGQDASALLKPALAMLSIPDDSTNLLYFGLELPRFDPLDRLAMAEGQRLLERNQPALALIPWSKLEHAWVGSGFTNGFTNLNQAPLSKMIRLVKLLCLSAVLEVELQHPHEAMESLRHAAIIGNTLKNDKPIHFMCKAAAQSLISLALERAMNRANLADADLASFPEFLTLTNIGATKELVIINERPLALFVASLLESGTSQLTTGVVSPVRWLTRAYEGALLYQEQDLLNYLDWNDHCRAALHLPMSNAIPILQNIEELQDNALKSRHKFLYAFEKDRPSFLTMEEPRITAFLFPELTAVAHVRLALAAVAVERWRSAHDGNVPDSLEELAPEFLAVVPADPFNGRLLRYEKLAKGYAIHSTGKYTINEGGKERPGTNAEFSHHEITFTVKR